MTLGLGWTEERIAELRRHVADNLSAAMIASELGGFTRNAVLGKIHRLGLSLGGRDRSGPEWRAKRGMAPMVKPPKPKRAAPRPKPRPLALLFAEQTELPPYQSPNAVTIEGLTQDTCRWPIGDRPSHDMLYCGAQRHAPFVYCTGHAQLAYKPAGRRP